MVAMLCFVVFTVVQIFCSFIAF